MHHYICTFIFLVGSVANQLVFFGQVPIPTYFMLVFCKSASMQIVYIPKKTR